MGDIPVFQTAQDIAFKMALAQYGQNATWENNNILDNVLFNDPTKPQRFNIIGGRGLSHVGYNNGQILKAYIEYLEGQFPGLWELVYADEGHQYIITGGIRYVCIKTASEFDGQTYRIYLDTAATEPIIQ